MSRVVVVHSRSASIAAYNPTGHAFGPFESLQAARDFHAEFADDCYKWAFDLVGPGEEDASAPHQDDHRHGERWQ